MYETLQVHGGQGYFTDEPYERMMRDARINTIGEGANEVLKAFIALVGMRDIGEGFKATLHGLKSPSKALPTAWRFGRERVGRLSNARTSPSPTPTCNPPRTPWRGASTRFSRTIERVLFRWNARYHLSRNPQDVIRPQLDQERIADAAIALYTASCTLARLDHDLSRSETSDADRAAGRLYLKMANRRFDQALHDLSSNDDPATLHAADAALNSNRDG